MIIYNYLTLDQSNQCGKILKMVHSLFYHQNKKNLLEMIPSRVDSHVMIHSNEMLIAMILGRDLINFMTKYCYHFSSAKSSTR